MKRLKMRVGLAGAVVGLGILAIAQAQRDRSLEGQTDSVALAPPADENPPRPLASDPDASQVPWDVPPPDADVVRANDEAIAREPASPPSAPPVQLAGYQQPMAAPSEPDDESSPDEVESADALAAAPSGFAFPMPAAGPASPPPQAPSDEAAAPAAAAAPPAWGLPAEHADGAAEPSGRPDAGESTPDAAGPSNLLRSPGEIASPQSNFPAAAGAPDAAPLLIPPPAEPMQGTPAAGSADGEEAAPSAQLAFPAPAASGPARDEERASYENLTAAPQPAEELPAGSASAPAPQPLAMANALPRERSPRAGAAPLAAHSQSATPRAEVEGVVSQPGERHLEGAQTPSVLIHKHGPEEVKVGKPASFVIRIQNTGAVAALDVQVHDRIPEGMRLEDAVPQPTADGDLLTWSLGDLEPGGERSITLQLVAQSEGELGSVARVSFEAAASVRTISTRPELKVVQKAPARVLVGQRVEIDIEISNPGSGAATEVVLHEDVPAGLEHPKGRQLDNHLGTIGPGETRRLTLGLLAIQPGVSSNVVRLTSADGVSAEHAAAIEVTAPQLAVDLKGPERRFLERQATFQLDIANTGSAMATNVNIIAYLDRGLSFVGTEYKGQYDPDRHAVYWSLAELPAGQSGSVPLKLLPVEPGEQSLQLEATADLGIEARKEKSITVDTLAELAFTVADDQDPIEVGSETTYEIRVSNSGSRDDSNVQLRLELPAGMEVIGADQEASPSGSGGIAFAPLKRLAAHQNHVYRVKVRGASPGTHVIRAMLTSDASNVPVTKEESTMVYADQ